MNSKATVFINPTSCVSGRVWVDVQGYADICPIISPTKRTEPRRINTTGEDRRPSGRLLIDFFSYIIGTLPIGEHYLGSLRSQPRGAAIFPVHHGADGIAGLQQFGNDDAAGLPGRAGY